VEDFRISELEDSIYRLEHLGNDKEKKLRKHEESIQDLCSTIQIPSI
jgi:hypothetical protein